MLETKIGIKSAILVLSLIVFLLGGFGYVTLQVLGHNQYNLSSQIEDELPQVLLEINRDPRSVKARTKLGLLYMQRQEWQKAIEHLQIAENSDKDNPFLLYQIGYAYGKCAKWELAEKYFREVVFRDERFAPALYALGQLSENKGNFAEALLYYQKAEAVEPKQAYTQAVSEINKMFEELPR